MAMSDHRFFCDIFPGMPAFVNFETCPCRTLSIL